MNIPLSAYIGSVVMTVCAPASRPISPAAPYDFRWGNAKLLLGVQISDDTSAALCWTSDKAEASVSQVRIA